MSDIRSIFDNVNSLSDWVAQQGKTSDGETSHLENKEVSLNLNTDQPAGVGDFKLLLAKEVCAFANTDSGVIAIGVNTAMEVMNNTVNLEDWLDKNCRDLIEPNLAGMDFKTCRDDKGNEFVLLYVPKGVVIPYRVGSVKSYLKQKKLVREYFQRVGTNSVPIPMPIVRSLYLSNNRQVDIAAHVEPLENYQGGSDEMPYIKLGLVITPDSVRLINEYYLDARVTVLNKNLERLVKEPIDIVAFGPNSPTRPVIPPDEQPHIIDEFYLRAKQPSRTRSAYDIGLVDYDPYQLDSSCETLPLHIFDKIGGLYIETKIACDGMPLKVDRRLLIFDKNISSDRLAEGGHEMSGWSRNCLVVSWYPVDNKTNLYGPIVQFMRDNNLGLIDD